MSQNQEFCCALLCTLLKIILWILQYLNNGWRYLKNSNRFEFSMTRAFITGRKIFNQESALLEKQKMQTYKYLCTGNSYQL
jgi:hypothetical protein